MQWREKERKQECSWCKLKYNYRICKTSSKCQKKNSKIKVELPWWTSQKHKPATITQWNKITIKKDRRTDNYKHKFSHSKSNLKEQISLPKRLLILKMNSTTKTMKLVISKEEPFWLKNKSTFNKLKWDK